MGWRFFCCSPKANSNIPANPPYKLNLRLAAFIAAFQYPQIIYYAQTVRQTRTLERIRNEYVQSYKGLDGLFGINSHCALLLFIETKSIISRSTTRHNKVCGLFIGYDVYKILSIKGSTIIELVISL